MADAFHLKPVISPEEQLKQPRGKRLHEATHLASSTDDIIAYLPTIGTRRSGKDLRDEFLRYYLSFALSETFERLTKTSFEQKKKKNKPGIHLKILKVKVPKVDSMLK
ncbi:hypothetical protein [Enterococcus mundtii]|uniref:hypothetical protein n=1 Tax=Enterococcus mundtii TaxID=53346 RepID=UPI0035C6D5FF